MAIGPMGATKAASLFQLRHSLPCRGAFRRRSTNPFKFPLPLGEISGILLARCDLAIRTLSSEVFTNVEDIRAKTTQDIDELSQLQKDSLAQKLPEQKVVFKTESIKSRAGRRGVHNLPDPTNPPMGLDPDKAFDSVFPFLKLPYLQPNTAEDVISFGSPDVGGFLDAKNKKIPLNAVFFGDNLHILRALPSNCIDLIYIDPPFFSGRNYNQIWGDDNEVRTFHDIWEDGLPSYLVWLNARLWEMRRVLKNTGASFSSNSFRRPRLWISPVKSSPA